MDEAARAAGRDPADVRGVYNIMGQVGGTGTDPFTGPVERWVDELTGLVDRGISGFILWPNGDDPDRQIELFATRVAPEVRGRVEQRG